MKQLNKNPLKPLREKEKEKEKFKGKKVEQLTQKQRNELLEKMAKDQGYL